ncbi:MULTISPECIES: ABC transporter substrate-binding protein [unclassified Oleiphilus]|uniref:ABC transporter substrate-binding protein n=2 Tax=unclassified Oleiphilus TaxID=2631174 RepID=UPI000A621248|nr:MULTISPECIES: ABC transporter substrate-binding protein [unclassified Oleiphilus]
MKHGILFFFFLSVLSFGNTGLAKELVIGLDADMSSVAKTGGVAIQRGAQLAINEINERGGVLGQTLVLSVRDHKGNPARGISNLKKFSKRENLVAVLGGVHTPVVLQELETIHENKLLFLVPWAAGTPITSNSFSPNYVFRASIRDKEAGPVLIKHAVGTGAKNVYLVLERTGWGRSNEVSMRQAAKESGLEVSGVSWINWGQKNVTKEVSEIAASDPDAIMLVANAPEGVVVANALLSNPALSNKPVIAHWGIAGGNFVNAVGLEQLSRLNVSTIQTFSFLNAYDQSKASEVLSAYQSTYDPNASQENIQGVVGFAQAYDLVHMLALAIKSAESIERPKVRDALEALETYHGLIKHYEKPFSPDQHDALLRDDYFMAAFNENGNLVPN